MRYLAAGEATFAHQCERRRHSVKVGWSVGTPALDERSLPAPCPDCGATYERVQACKGEWTANFDEEGAPIKGSGDHDCHPVAGHVSRSDDPAVGLGPEPEPDPLEVGRQRQAYVRWVIGQRQVVAQTAALLQSDDFPSDWHREDCQLTHELALAALKKEGIGS